MLGQKEKAWNQDFPESFILTGKDPQKEVGRTWIITRSDDISPALAAITDLSNPGERLKIQPRFLDYQISSLPKIKGFSGDLLELEYYLNAGIQVNSLYWIPDSRTICGEINIYNLSEGNKKVSLHLIFNIDQSSSGTELSNLVYEGKNLLQGKAGRQKLLCFMSGGPSFDPGSEVSLINNISLGANSSKNIRWSVIIDDSLSMAMDRLDELVELSWKREISQGKIKLQNQILITTPDPDWNYALAYSRIQAGSILNNLAYQKDDFDNRSMPSLDGLLLFNALYPLDENDIQKVLKSTFDPPNKIVKNNLPAYPFHSELLWQVSEVFGLDHLIGPEIKRIESSLSTWFDERDSDKDGIPEMIFPGYFDLIPSEDILNHHNPDPEGNPYLESPALSSLLINEIRRITDLRERMGLKPINQCLLDYQAKMVEHIHSSWDERSGRYQTRDSDSHLVSKQKMIGEDISPGFNLIREDLPFPSRIALQISANLQSLSNKNFFMVIHGRGQDGSYRIERISRSDIIWKGHSFWTYSRLIYTRVEYLYLQGIGNFDVRIHCPGSSQKDISIFFPIWAELPDNSRLETMIKKHITNTGEYWSPFGIRTSPQVGGELVQLPWNYLLLEAFLKYEEYQLAKRLFSRLMKGVIEQIRSSGRLYPGIDSITGRGQGPAISAAGLIPVRFLLKLAGIEIRNRTLNITGIYSLDFPLTIQFRGTIITRTGKDTIVSVPGEKILRYKGDQEFEFELP